MTTAAVVLTAFVSLICGSLLVCGLVLGVAAWAARRGRQQPPADEAARLIGELDLPPDLIAQMEERPPG